MSLAVRRLRLAWTVVLVTLTSYFALHLIPGEWALVLRQVVFMIPLTAAALAVATIVRMAPPSDELRAWSALGLCVAALWFSEAYFGLYQVYVSPAGPPTPSAFDAFNLAAAFCVLVAIAISAGFARLPRATLSVLVSDLVSMSVVLYVTVYVFWSRVLSGPATGWQMEARWAGYSAVGVAIVAGVAWLARDARSARDRDLIYLLAGALVVFAIEMVLWPLAQAGQMSEGSTLMKAVDSSVILAGYCLMMMAAMTRLVHLDRGWRLTMGRSVDVSRIWQSSLVAGLVLVAAVGMAFWASRLPDGSGEQGLFVAAGSLAIMALVARTGFAMYQMSALRSTSSTDPVTGALNHRAFQEQCDELLSSGRRRGAPFILAAIDLDGFSRVNGMLGHARGDAALRDVVLALQSAVGSTARVYRLTGDEFAVVSSEVASADATQFASGLLEAICGVEPSPGLSLSASIGVVASDDCSISKEELLRRADAARVWAKYHGKGRVVAYDARIVRALGFEERMRLDEEHSFIGVARALAAAADARDARNHYHARNVASLAVLLAEDFGLEPHHVSRIKTAAVLHDVGRIAMPDPVMPAFKRGQRQSRADDEHAALGAQLVGSLGIEGLSAWVRAHHERWDGTGFPDGLAGEEIPIEARIIALADAYDGMTAGRRGGAPMSKSAALQEIDHSIGSRFDPELAERFIEVVGRTASLGWADEWTAL